MIYLSLNVREPITGVPLVSNSNFSEDTSRLSCPFHLEWCTVVWILVWIAESPKEPPALATFSNGSVDCTRTSIEGFALGILGLEGLAASDSDRVARSKVCPWIDKVLSIENVRALLLLVDFFRVAHPFPHTVVSFRLGYYDAKLR
jgi:hypothetical protein